MAAAAARADAESGGSSMRPVKLFRSPLAFSWTCAGSFKPGLNADPSNSGHGCHCARDTVPWKARVSPKSRSIARASNRVLFLIRDTRAGALTS